MARVRILLVDDDEVVCSTLAKVLKLNRFDVTLAGGVPDALKLILTEQFDVLVTDLHMPGARRRPNGHQRDASFAS